MDQGRQRDRLWENLDESWDVLVLGGGITGAGILREAARAGLKTLLVDRRDFAWGTSSRSSKLVHGGLRYLREGKTRLAASLVRQRNRLLAEAPGLVDPLGFLIPIYRGGFARRWLYQFGLAAYDLLGLQRTHRFHKGPDFQMLAPHLDAVGLKGGFRYLDAQTDDARLVLRVIREAVAAGGTAMNYAAATELLRDGRRVVGVRLSDELGGPLAEVRARVVINATGAWADQLRTQLGRPARIRPLRGSHLVFPRWRLPVAQALAFAHPTDGRFVFVLPWEGATLVGTTDLDHDRPLNEEPSITPQETAYLMAQVKAWFPSLGLTLHDVTGSFAGVRAVIGSGKTEPSKESRDHVVWDEGGLLTVTGGKLTNFRLIALHTLRAVRHRLNRSPGLERNAPVFQRASDDLADFPQLDGTLRQRLLGRYGAEAREVLADAEEDALGVIPGTQTLWAELRWAARSEWVVHLDDLLLRRVRIGLLLPEGGKAYLPRIRALCQSELGWNDDRWEAEQEAYLDLCRRCYHLPERATAAGEKAMPAEARPASSGESSRSDGGHVG